MMRCKDCVYCRDLGRNNHAYRHMFICIHPLAEHSFKTVCPRSNRMPGFIGFGKKFEFNPDIQSAPRWCPLKPKNKNLMQEKGWE